MAKKNNRKHYNAFSKDHDLFDRTDPRVDLHPHGEAKKYYLRAKEIKPDSADAYMRMGNSLYKNNNYEQAIENYNKAIEINPDSATAHYNLGMILKKSGMIYEAIKSFQRAITLKPDYALAITGLGSALIDAGEYIDGELCLRRALEIIPDDPAIHHSLGRALAEQNRLSEAVSSYEKALELDPGLDYAYCNLGNIFLRYGNIKEASLFYEKALELKPEMNLYNSNLLLALHYSEQISPDEIYFQHQKWSIRHELPLKHLLKPHKNDRTPDRKIRIGYVSPDFADHPVSYYFEPLLASHDRNKFEVFCYSDVTRADAMTAHLKNKSDSWRDIFNKSDEAVTEIILSDRIDILVDLAGHTARNRMMVFARKPSPIQVTYLGYPNTTGLETMDYRITDFYADPQGMTEHLHSEELVRMPHGFLCYQPLETAPDVGSPPSLKSGHITFGSFNNRSKITPEMVRGWAEILHAVPNARLIFKFKFLSDPLTQRFLEDMLDKNNVPMDRVELYNNIPSKKDHLDLYNRIDIALDTFPYNGTTTTCEALWMGVPVITLKGKVHVSRASNSILSVIGLKELVASSKQEYINKAVELAADIEKREYLRSNLRSLMRSSPLMDGPGFTKALEHEFRQFWHRWCRASQKTRKELTCADHEQIAALLQQGEDFFYTGNIEHALLAFQKATTIAPTNVTALNNLGVIYWHTGNIAKATEAFTQALEIEPENNDAASNIKELEKSLHYSKY